MSSFENSETNEEPRLFFPHLWVKEWGQRRAECRACFPSCSGSFAGVVVGWEQGASWEVLPFPEDVWSWGFVCTCACALTHNPWHRVAMLSCEPVGWPARLVCWLTPGYVLFCSRCLDVHGGQAFASHATLSLMLGPRDISSRDEGRLRVENWGVFFSFMSRETIYCQIQSENCRWCKYIAYFCATVFVYLLWLKFNFYL